MKQLPPKFSDFFVGKEYVVTRHLLYDADTINIVIPIEGQEVTFPVRMLGYDRIEKKLKSSETDKLEKEDLLLLKQSYEKSE